MSKKLLSFLCIGLVILILDSWFDSSYQDKTIILYDDEINSLIETWTAQVGRPPNDKDLKGIINQLVEEEILYREALKLDLDKDDIIIKRRLAQKIGFLKQEEQNKPPTELQLKEYFESKEAEYSLDKKLSFTHLYFSKEKNGAERAITSLKIIKEQEGLPDSDPFLVGKNFVNKTLKEIDRDFGNSFSANITQGTIGSWLGPFDSIYGSHLVKISKIVEAKKPVYEEVKKAVLMDYLLEKKQQEMRNYIDELKEEYEIQINPKFNF
tara:strand:- start:321 stop:1121 length:801 start_codon:yes stop_codon:yes gene_type:complete